jgi:hypothetical protein
MDRYPFGSVICLLASVEGLVSGEIVMGFHHSSCSYGDGDAMEELLVP